MDAQKFRKKAVAGAGITIAGLALTVVAFFQVENYRGGRAWAVFQKEMVERGESLDFDSFFPKPIPDEQNFAAIPLFKAAFEGEEAAKKANESVDLSAGRREPRPSLGQALRGNPIDLELWETYLDGMPLQQALEQYSPVLDEIRMASQRPLSRFPVEYQKGFAAALPHLTLVIKAASLLSLRAQVALSGQRPEAALADLMLLFRLAEAVATEPFFITSLVENSVLSLALNVVWQGTANRQWNVSELSAIKARLESIDFIASQRRAFRGERALSGRFWDKARGTPENADAWATDEETKKSIRFVQQGPKGWLFQNQVSQFRFYQQMIDAMAERPIDFEAFVFHPRNAKPYHRIANMSAGPAIKVAKKAVYLQDRIHLALIACALAEYQIANGRYPKSLGDLIPTYLASLPLDLITEKPFHYRLSDDGANYTLYSIGWNRTDDSGKVATKENGNVNEMEGDWVWFCSPQNISAKKESQ